MDIKKTSDVTREVIEDTIKDGIKAIKQHGQEWILKYANRPYDITNITAYHGTHLSNGTSIRYDGLKPAYEKMGMGNIYVVTNPIYAASHIFLGGQTDTYRSDKGYPYKDTYAKLYNDPFILLKIDISGLKRDKLLESKSYRLILTNIVRQRVGLPGLDFSEVLGIPLDEQNVPPEYIKAVIHTVDGRILELTLDDLMNKVLIENELGIVPDFLEREF